MAILYCHHANFVFDALHPTHPEWDDHPVALLNDDGIVQACSPQAIESGVLHEMRARQARARCPDLRLVPLDAARIEELHQAFRSVLLATGLPVEITAPGSGYCDLRSVARSPRDAQPICADLGRQLRSALGDALTPALGCDHGKFTARAAAHITRPGRLRVVDLPDEAAFLAPLSTALLPLPPLVLNQLRWLGIATLADFARLPQSAVVQRWGEAGRMAQQLALGRDPRPVQAAGAASPEPVRTDFETPCENVAQAAASVRRDLEPHLAALAAQLLGCRTLTLQLEFLDHRTRTHEIAFAAPVVAAASIAAAVTHALRSTPWPAPLISTRTTISAAAELPAGQLTLFDEPTDDAITAIDEPAQRLAHKHPGVFFHAQLVEPAHPVVERRIEWKC
jgi:protein ImuB